MKKKKTLIAIGLSVVLFSTGFTTFANTQTDGSHILTKRSFKHTMSILQNDPHNKWYSPHSKNKSDAHKLWLMTHGSGGGRDF